MGPNVVLFGWNRSIPGREAVSGAHFQEFNQYLAGQQQSGGIDGFDVVFLDLHGGDLNGFFLIHGPSEKLDALLSSEAWVGHMIRAGLHLQGAGHVRGVTGAGVMERMALWVRSIPT